MSLIRGLLAAGSICGSALAADWPQYGGPAGDFSIPAGPAMTADAAALKPLWDSAVHLGPGKIRITGNNAPMPSVGVASPIVVGDLVLQAYTWPSGAEPKAQAELKGGKRPACPLDRLVRADDCLVAVDRATGATRWTFTAKEQGVNNVPDKRGGWGVTPAAAEGRIFTLGSGAMLYAVSLTDGRELWRTAIEPLHGQLQRQADELLVAAGAGRRPFDPMSSSLVVADGILVVPDFAGAEGGLIGVDPASGGIRWRIAGVLSGYSTPTIWRDGEGRALLLCGTAKGALTLIDPLEGKALWRRSGLGQLTAPVLANRAGLVMLDLNPVTAEKSPPHYGCVAISRSGVEERWRLAKPFGSRTGDGHGYIRVRPWGEDRFLHYAFAVDDKAKSHAQILSVHSAADGRLLASTDGIASMWDSHYLPVGDRILGQYELGHWRCELSWFAVHGDRIVPVGSRSRQPDGASNYEVPFMQPPLDGRIILRFYAGTYTRPGDHGGLRCYDLTTTGKP